MTGLEKITEKIEAQAKEQAQRIIDDAQAECDRIAASYAEEAEKIKAKIDAQAQADAENIILRAKATAAMAKRNVILDAKSKLTAAAFKNARNELLLLPSDKYIDLMSVLLSSALRNQVEADKKTALLEGDDYTDDKEPFSVIFNKKDKEKHAAAILEAARRMSVGKISSAILENIKISDKTADIDGGLILARGGIECNCSFDMLFSQLRGKCEVEVYNILFGAENK